jgi:hypothetical protein
MTAMLVNSQNHTVIRNYLIAMISVVMISAGVADLVNSPARIAQQDRLDGYGRYISASLVSGAMKADR